MTTGTELTVPAVAEAPHRHPPASDRRPHFRIVPGRRWPGVNVRELWLARDLLGFFVWRDIKVRYAQTALGIGWAVLQPVLAMLIFTVIFGRFAHIPSDGAPYAAFALSGLVPWTFFSTALTGSSNSLVLNAQLLTKVYFPRLTIPFAPLFAALVDFTVAAVVLLIVLGAYRVVPSPLALVVVPIVLAISMMTAAGVGCWLAALNVQYRDVRHLTPFILQVWLYASPVAYPLSLVPPELRAVYSLNPMVGAIEGFRAVLLGRTGVPWPALLLGAASSAVLFVAGGLYFRHVERVFADVA